jgi:RND superfamily putative drug exporter
MVVVPAVMTLLGRWNWYLPSWLSWMPELHVEGDPAPMPPTPVERPPVPITT